MRPSDVKKAIAMLREANVNIFLSGPPGGGKSQIIGQAAEEMDLEYLDVRVLLHEPSDFKFPIVDMQKAMVRWVQSVFPTDPKWKGIVCLEEVPQAAPLVQAALLGLVHERRLGEYVPPEGLQFIATGNRQEDRAGGHRIITPLLNRFVHLDLEVSNDDWQEWAIHNGVTVEVRSFLKWKPTLLHKFNPALNERAFPTPRSWEFVSKMLPHVTDDAILSQVVSGAVGDGPAAEFLGFLKIHRALPDLDEVFKNPAKASVPKDGPVLYALSGAIAERCRNGDKDVLDAAVTYHSRMGEEFSVLTMRDILQVNREVLKLPKTAQWIKAHKDVFIN